MAGQKSRESHRPGPDQDDEGSAREYEATVDTRLRLFERVGDSGPDPAVGDLVAQPFRGMVQTLAQQALAIVLGRFEPVHHTILLAALTISARA